MTAAEIRIDLSRPIGTISPLLHGHFAEQLFECVNGGLWDVSSDRFRPEFLAAGADLGLELIRWPGGCFADAYRWRDGIGPADRRPRTVASRWGVDEIGTHRVGSHEFMDFCRQTGARSWLNLNVGTGSPRESAEWFEYMTMASGTSLSDLRAEHGAPEPFGIDFWGIGNESWDCGGKFTPAEYAEQYRRHESAIPRLRGVPRRFIAAGPDGNKPEEREVWTRELLSRLALWRRPAVHAVDAHFYTWGDREATGTSDSYTGDQFAAMIARTLEVEPMLREQRALLDAFDPTINLVLGEWGNWHPDANGNRFRTRVTIRDAVCVSATLDLLHSMSREVSAATYTMLCNVLSPPFQTDGGVPILTPVYHAFHLHRTHRGGEALPVEIDSDPVSWSAAGEAGTIPGLSASASRKDGRIHVTAANLNPWEDCEVRLGPEVGRVVDSRLLASDDPAWSNDAARPDRLSPRRLDVDREAFGSRILRLPPASIAAVTLEAPTPAGL
ncbi:MAG: hypothetical protein MH204_01310 [Fimbriimonadaceae bacterium]|nr:hypothetical protein [Fimbriimonadaceae bacterium]